MSARTFRPKLDDVTLVAVTSVALTATIASLRRSMQQCDFARTLLLSDREPEGSLQGIEWRRIGRLASKADYSRFMLRELANHVETSHALCAQWDSFVLQGSSWREEFLGFDYIGAVWPHFTDNHRVGNGGFSLRSRRLLDACNDISLSGEEAEDIAIGRRCRPSLERRGIRFATEEIARQFAYERTQPTGCEFGFHGVFNLVRYVSKDDALALFDSLELGMIAPNERTELLRWAILRGRLKLARSLLARRRPRQN